MIGAADMARLHGAAFLEERTSSEAEFATLLDQPTVFAIGSVQAFALVRIAADEAELLTIATDPKHQRQGLAKQLMSQWHAKAAQRGARRALLEVAEDNIGARALYSETGYKEFFRRQEYYRTVGGAHVDAILMDRELP